MQGSKRHKTYDWASGGDDRNSKSKNKTTSLQLSSATWVQDCQPIDETTDYNDCRANEHASLATPSVNTRANKWKSGKATNLVDDRRDSLPRPVIVAMEEVKELAISAESAEEHAIEAVHGLAEAAK